MSVVINSIVKMGSATSTLCPYDFAPYFADIISLTHTSSPQIFLASDANPKCAINTTTTEQSTFTNTTMRMPFAPYHVERLGSLLPLTRLVWVAILMVTSLSLFTKFPLTCYSPDRPPCSFICVPSAEPGVSLPVVMKPLSVSHPLETTEDRCRSGVHLLQHDVPYFIKLKLPPVTACGSGLCRLRSPART